MFFDILYCRALEFWKMAKSGVDYENMELDSMIDVCIEELIRVAENLKTKAELISSENHICAIWDKVAEKLESEGMPFLIKGSLKKELRRNDIIVSDIFNKEN